MGMVCCGETYSSSEILKWGLIIILGGERNLRWVHVLGSPTEIRALDIVLAGR